MNHATIKTTANQLIKGYIVLIADKVIRITSAPLAYSNIIEFSGETLNPDDHTDIVGNAKIELKSYDEVEVLRSSAF